MDKTNLYKVRKYNSAKKIICIFLAMIFVFTAHPQLMTKASAHTVYAPLVQQAYSNWCWAACAEMAGKNVYPSSWYDQYSVVSYIKGAGNPNVGGNASETASGCTIVANSLKYYMSHGNKFNQGDIQNYINSGYALVAITGNASSGNILHDIIIYGYDTSAGVDYVYLIDPSTGTSLFRTRGQLDNGSWKNGVYLPYGGTIYPYCAGLFPNP